MRAAYFEKVKGGWRVVKGGLYPSPSEPPVFIGISGQKVKGEGYFWVLSSIFSNSKTGQQTAIPIQTQKGDRPPPVPKDERDISVDLVNNEANHFALYL